MKINKQPKAQMHAAADLVDTGESQEARSEHHPIRRHQPTAQSQVKMLPGFEPRQKSHA